MSEDGMTRSAAWRVEDDGNLDYMHVVTQLEEDFGDTPSLCSSLVSVCLEIKNLVSKSRYETWLDLFTKYGLTGKSVSTLDHGAAVAMAQEFFVWVMCPTGADRSRSGTAFADHVEYIKRELDVFVRPYMSHKERYPIVKKILAERL